MASSRQVVLITGANTGIGYELVKALYNHASKGYDIIVGGRSLEKVEEAINSLKMANKESTSTLSPLQIDISSDESITKAFETISSSFDRVDVLVNNAGTYNKNVLLRAKLTLCEGAAFDKEHADGKISMREAWNKAWDTNVAGTQVMTHTFVPLLLNSSDPRLLFITSGTSSLTESSIPALRYNKAPPKGWPKPPSYEVAAYRSSKTGMNMMMRNWERVLREDDVKVFCISPGFLATGLNSANGDELKKMGAGDPAVGGEFIRDVIDGQRDGDEGKVIRKDMIQSW